MSALTRWIVELVVAAFGKAIAEIVSNWLAAKKQGKEIREAAVKDAASRTLEDIAEVADAQAQVNATDRGSAADVARRLRDRLRADAAGR